MRNIGVALQIVVEFNFKNKSFSKKNKKKN